MSETEWERIHQIDDEEIDFSDIPEVTPEQMEKAVPLSRLFPELVYSQYIVALDEDVAEWVIQNNPQRDLSYAFINQILRERIEQRESLEETLRRVIREELQSVTT